MTVELVKQLMKECELDERLAGERPRLSSWWFDALVVVMMMSAAVNCFCQESSYKQDRLMTRWTTRRIKRYK
jgi:hypothetical protein